MTERLSQFLQASMTANQFVLHSGCFVDVFCPVVLHVETPLGDSATFAGIELPLWPIRQEIPFLDFSAEEAITKEFQGQLLAFRLANLQAARTSRFDPPELTSPVREAARSIGACFSSDPHLLVKIISQLQSADARARVLSSTSQQAVLIEGMLFLCHEKNGNKGGTLRVSELADVVRVLNLARDEMQSPSPRAIGEILRALGFATTRLDKQGRGVILCRDVNFRVHDLAVNFGVPSLWKSTPGCNFCKLVGKSDASRVNGP